MKQITKATRQHYFGRTHGEKWGGASYVRYKMFCKMLNEYKIVGVLCLLSYSRKKERKRKKIIAQSTHPFLVKYEYSKARVSGFSYLIYS